jgi:hypothetical protein
MVEKPSETKEKDGIDEDDQAEGNEDDEEAEEEMDTHDGVREDREAIEQRVIANNRNEVWSDCGLGDMTNKEGEQRDTGSGGEESMAGENDRDSDERRKRPLDTCEAFDYPTLGDYLNKRSKGDDSESEDTAATDDLPKQTFNLKTTLRLRTSSPTSTTASPASVIEIVR